MMSPGPCHHHFFLVSNGRLMDLVRWELLNQIEAGGGTLSSFVPISRYDTPCHPVFVLVTIEGIHPISSLKYLFGNCALLRWVYQAPHVHCGYGMEEIMSQYGEKVIEQRIIGRRKRQRFRRRHDNSNDSPLHILADYRGLSTAQEIQAVGYVMRYFCDGGDQCCRIMSREALVSNHPTSISAHATTRMDFTRSYLTVTSARIRSGMVVLDPFAGSGAILQVASQMGASAVLGNDLIPNNCRLCSSHNRQISSVVASIHHSPWTNNVVDCIVTDPPYGKRTQALSFTTSSVVENASTSVLLDLLHCADRVLVEGGRLVFWWPGVDGNSVLRFLEELLRTCGLVDRLQIVAVAGDDLGLGKSTVHDDTMDAPDEEDNNDNGNNEETKRKDYNMDEELLNACTESRSPQQQHQQQRQEDGETRKTEWSHQDRKMLLQCRWQRCLVVMQKGNNHSNNNHTTTKTVSSIHLLPTIFSSASLHSYPVFETSDREPEIMKKDTVSTGDIPIPPTMTMLDHKKTRDVNSLEQLFIAARRGDTATLDRIATDLDGVFGTSLVRCPVDTTPLNHPTSGPDSCTIPFNYSNARKDSIWDIADAHDCHLLICAAGFGKSNVLRWLLQHGANVNIVGCGKTSGSALIRASRFGHVDCVGVLLEAGADPYIVDHQGLTAIAHALAFDHLTVVECFVAAARLIQREPACQNDVSKILQSYLVSSTALHITAQWGSIRCMTYLLMCVHTDVNVALADGTTPLHVASRWGHVVCVKELLRAGAHVNQCDNMGNRPMDLAAMWGRTTCMALLTSENIDMNKGGKAEINKIK